MSRKDYEKMAQAIRQKINNEMNWEATLALFRVAWRMADIFEAENERFDRKQFLEAAGVDEDRDGTHYPDAHV